MAKLPQQLESFITPEKLTYTDCLDLLMIASNALKQCHSQGYASMDILNASEWSDCLNDVFEGIAETDEFLDATLTVEDWSNLAQFAAFLSQSKESD
ncbi:hypothetical protein NG799_28570 [Laspinema sp. D1]|uniref:Acyl carrier protein n=1 Tax=Laspinema palackyanum D2a TaxID=2953684 RepID=A0ABT2N259_9CYAN|nr:hypothetical protein [Laspinema sp. D2a]